MARYIPVALALFILASCGGGGDSSGPAKFPIGGTVSGLASGESLTLSDNGTDSLSVTGSGAFSFHTQLASGTTYSVAVSVQPSKQLCSVTGSSGTVGSQGITSVAVSCVGPFAVGGTVSGLNSGVQLVLTNNGSDSNTIAANGAFTFATALGPASNYAVAIAQEPSGEQCFVANATGVASANSATSVAVTCGVPTLNVLAGALGGPGNIDGQGPAARFYYPQDVALDTAGNLYVADDYNKTVRRISASGAVTTIAGTPGQTGTADGTGAAAEFNNPVSLAVDKTGIIYLVDAGANTIRRITQSGVVTTLAGSPYTNGTTDGTGAAVRFSSPGGIRLTPSGTLYLADNNRIRNITPAGLVSTIYTGAMLGRLAIDAGGNLFATDTSLKAAVTINLATGAETVLANGFQAPGGLDIGPAGTGAAGTLYVTDAFACTVSAIAPGGAVSTLAGTSGQCSAGDGTGASARFYLPAGMSIDGSGTLFLADPGNESIRKITAAGVVTTVAGVAPQLGHVNATGAAARFNGPSGLTADASGTLYVGDAGNASIREVSPTGVVTDVFPTLTSLSLGETLTRDSAGNFYVAVPNAILKANPSGAVTTLAGGLGAPPGSADGTGAAAQFHWPTGIAVDGSGNLYVTDMLNYTIRKVTPAGVVTTLAGQAGQGGLVDGSGSVAKFTLPGVVIIDSSGTLYVTDGNAIRTISRQAVVATLAGSATAGDADGIGTAARFSSPFGLAFGAEGSLYVSDTSNHTIRKITSPGVVTTIAGAPGKAGVAPGALPASLNTPLELAYVGTTLYVVDGAENSLLSITYAP